MATVDVTQGGIVVHDKTANVDVTQGGIVVHDAGPDTKITQGGVITYEGSSNIDVTQSGIILYGAKNEAKITQGGVVQFIEGLHRLPEFVVVVLGDTHASLLVRFVWPEWEELQYEVEHENSGDIIFLTNKLPQDVGFSIIHLTNLITNDTYIGRVRARTSAGWSDWVEIEFTPTTVALPTGENIFTTPLFGEPVATNGDRTDLSAIRICWRTQTSTGLAIGGPIELLIADPFDGTFIQIADTNDLANVNPLNPCIFVDLSAFTDGFYILQMKTQTFDYFHPGFAIDRENKVTYLPQAPLNLEEWTHRAGKNLPWDVSLFQGATCSQDVPQNVLSRKFRQHGDPDTSVNGPTVIGPIFPDGFVKARAASTGSIWVGGFSLGGYLFGGEVSEVSVYSAVGRGFSVKAHVGQALLGPRGFGDSTGVSLQAEFGVVVSVDPGIFGVSGFSTNFRVPIITSVSHPCLFVNKNPTKWPLHLMVEHEWVDLAAGLVHVRAFLGAPYNLTIDEIVDTGFDMTTLECNCVGIGRFKIDNFNVFGGGDPGWGQFDNFHYSGDKGSCEDICGESIEIPIEEPPEPGLPEECPPTIITNEALTPLFLIDEGCPEPSLFSNDSPVPVSFESECPDCPGAEEDSIDILDPIFNPPVVDPSFQTRVGRAFIILPQLIIAGNGIASKDVSFGESDITLPQIDIAAQGEVLISGNIDADVPSLEGEGEGSGS